MKPWLRRFGRAASVTFVVQTVLSWFVAFAWEYVGSEAKC